MDSPPKPNDARLPTPSDTVSATHSVRAAIPFLGREQGDARDQGPRPRPPSAHCCCREATSPVLGPPQSMDTARDCPSASLGTKHLDAAGSTRRAKSLATFDRVSRDSDHAARAAHTRPFPSARGSADRRTRVSRLTSAGSLGHADRMHHAVVFMLADVTVVDGIPFSDRIQIRDTNHDGSVGIVGRRTRAVVAVALIVAAAAVRMVLVLGPEGNVDGIRPDRERERLCRSPLSPETGADDGGTRGSHRNSCRPSTPQHSRFARTYLQCSCPCRHH